MNLSRFKSFGVVAILVACIFVGASATAPKDAPKRNLKVLPKNISDEDLDKVMDGFKAALGVKCNHCHAQSTTDPNHLDFASDAKPEKGSARYMMKMTAKLNKKFFHVDVTKMDQPAKVTCMTCHNGNVHPKPNS
jgi:hypothetical protein